MALFRRRNHAPLSQTCTAGACARSCKSRRAPRPRKPDGKLSRHGLGARRVALLAPRGVLSKYRYPLSYVGAMTKIFGKVQKLVPHFGRRQAYSEWGRSAEGEEGVSYSHVKGRQLVYSSNPTHPPSEHPRARRTARSNALSVFDHGGFIFQNSEIKCYFRNFASRLSAAALSMECRAER